MPPASGTRDPATGRLQAITVLAAPYGAGVFPAPSSMTLEVSDSPNHLKIATKQADGALASYWKPSEVEVDIDGVRAIRDACNLFLDRFHDESDR